FTPERPKMEVFLLSVFFFVSVLISVSSLDDAFIDIFALGIVRLKRNSINEDIEIPPTAVFVANWQEADVIEKMVEGNLARIPIDAVEFYLGVYPNDTETLSAALRLAEKHPDRVRVIVNSLPGPTSKGQMLNEMFRQVFSTDDDGPELVVLHDSEDVIDPRTFSIYAAYAKDHDFIQVPVFSLTSTHRSLVASTYMDEFAERHTREMVVRDAVGAMIPSAGVGTCMTKRLIRHFIKWRGAVLLNGCVTEDYILGVEVKRAGFRSAFASASTADGKMIDFVATREYFPSSFSASIRQKTRWVYGICFEGMHKLGWGGDPWDVYFFLRDRKGMVTNFLPPIALFLMIALLMEWIDSAKMPDDLTPIFEISIALNFIALLLRYVVRVASLGKVYGGVDFMGIAERWPVAAAVNFMAVFRAWKTYLTEAEFGTKPIAWSKTQHEVPDDFLNLDK
ncbi:MAG: glycosyl transferase family protein, partial [Xanthobacteraceae bacterium]